MQIDAISADQGAVDTLSWLPVSEIPKNDSVIPTPREQYARVLLIELYSVDTRTVTRRDGLLTSQLKIETSLLLIVDLDHWLRTANSYLSRVLVVIDAVELRVERIVLDCAETFAASEVVVLQLALRVGRYEDIPSLELRSLGSPFHVRERHVGPRRVDDVGHLASVHVEHTHLPILTSASDVLVLQVKLAAVHLRVRLAQTETVLHLDRSFRVVLNRLRIADWSLLLNLMLLLHRLLLALSQLALLLHFTYYNYISERLFEIDAIYTREFKIKYISLGTMDKVDYKSGEVR
jgi:hypothetical protein